MTVSRRSFIAGSLSATAIGLLPWGASSALASSRPDGKVVSPAEAIRRLQRGNARHVQGRALRKTFAPPGQSPEAGQWPFAAIVSCSDSRVVPEDAFDIAGKNLFVIRNAGNVTDDVTLGSLEYAVEHTGVSLIVVMGHTYCGAVTAANTTLKTGVEPEPHIDSIVELILPAIVSLPNTHTLDQAITANAQYQADQVQNFSPLIAEKTHKGSVGIVQATYDLTNGRVTFIPALSAQN